MGIQSRRTAQFIGLQAACSIGLDRHHRTPGAGESNLESGPISGGRPIPLPGGCVPFSSTGACYQASRDVVMFNIPCRVLYIISHSYQGRFERV